MTHLDDADLAATWLGRAAVVLACDGDLHRKYDSPYRRALHVRVSESGFQHLELRLAETTR